MYVETIAIVHCTVHRSPQQPEHLNAAAYRRVISATNGEKQKQKKNNIIVCTSEWSFRSNWNSHELRTSTIWN